MEGVKFYLAATEGGLVLSRLVNCHEKQELPSSRQKTAYVNPRVIDKELPYHVGMFHPPLRRRFALLLDATLQGCV